MLVSAGLLTSIASAQDMSSESEASVARQWTDGLLFAIRRDLARPTVHARNLYHLSAAMFDAWAIYDPNVTTQFATATSEIEACRSAFALQSSASGLNAQERDDARKQAVGMAAWTLLNHRFEDNRQNTQILEHFEQIASSQGLSSRVQSMDSGANLGQLVGRCVIATGLNDRSNELNNYRNLDYAPLNTPLDPTMPGNPGITDPNRWQPLQLAIFIDQSGIVTDTPEFLGADWGQLEPFALESSDRTEVTIDDTTVPVWLDPGVPPLLGENPEENQLYQINHLTVALWSAHLDPANEQTINISPGSIGNLPELNTLPNDQASIIDEYNILDGGLFKSRGHETNPFTSQAYEDNVVPLGDYTRVLAEFWADGPDSETPPGHWFGIYNETVADHPQHDQMLAGMGQELDALSYDVIVYLALGGALHDSAIAAWSAKRAYDYARPITAIRYMASLGQSTDTEQANYHVHGVPLIPGRVETVLAGDPLAGADNINVGKIKGLVWLGPEPISNPNTDTAGVGWKLLENWWPYQRPTFVTPPFAGYVSGHSTFSRAAAEVLTAATGDAFFPGGMAEFVAQQNSFLVFEQGPSVDVRLQWATYRDAADQTSLSRIWGGIHPPADDLVGRKMGEVIGVKAWQRVASMVDQAYPDIDLTSSFNNNADQPDVPIMETSAMSGGGGGCTFAHNGNDASLLLLLLLFITNALWARLRPTQNKQNS